MRRSAPTPPALDPTPAEEARCLAIARWVWTGFDKRERDDRVQRLIEVEEALRGPHVHIPTLSAADRARIETVAKEVP
jgi:hypothetical protein